MQVKTRAKTYPIGVHLPAQVEGYQTAENFQDSFGMRHPRSWNDRKRLFG